MQNTCNTNVTGNRETETGNKLEVSEGKQHLPAEQV